MSGDASTKANLDLAAPGSPSVSNLVVRDAVDADLPRIVAIYNESIAGGWSTADTRPVTVESRRTWFAARDPARRPIWVAEVETADGPEIVGWIGLTSFYQGRPAYDATAEVSTYVANAWNRRGIGTELKRRMIERCPDLGVTTLISIYFDHNPATEKINAGFGFEEAGWLRDVAVVAGESRGVRIALLRIPPKPDDSSGSPPDVQ